MSRRTHDTTERIERRATPDSVAPQLLRSHCARCALLLSLCRAVACRPAARAATADASPTPPVESGCPGSLADERARARTPATPVPARRWQRRQRRARTKAKIWPPLSSAAAT